MKPALSSLLIFPLLLGSFPSAFATKPADAKLVYDRPATQWMTEALPVGNGHMGAMLFGGLDEDRIQFNEGTLWVGHEDDTGAYQNFGEITVCFPGAAAVTDPGNTISSPGQGLDASFDGAAGTKWCVENRGRFPITWQKKMPAHQTGPLTSYTLTSAGDVPDRDPKAWRFLGSQDGRNWTLLDERKDEPVWPERGAPKTFNFTNKTAYAHYKIEFLEVHGVPHFQIAEIALGSVAPAPQAKNYRRELDLTRAVHTVSYEENGVRYTREAFASYPANVMALRFTADKPGAISANLTLSDAHGATIKAEGNRITSIGAIPGSSYAGGKKTWLPLRYAAELRATAQGGRVFSDDKGLHVEGANSVLLLLSAATDYARDRGVNWRGADPLPIVTARNAAATEKGFAALLKEHLADYQPLFRRVDLNLGDAAPSTLTTDQRLASYASAKSDRGLEELIFHYGRYLLISSSRAGSTPATLQGKWNNSNNPPWRCDYHGDINVQMNYWASATPNLPECFSPFADWIETIRPVREEATREAFKTRGWAMRGENGLFGGSSWEWCTGAAGWLCLNLYEQYLFTQDVAYLRAKAYPAMKSACEFWLDSLKELPDGTLVGPKNYSPEQMHIQEEGVSFDQQVIWDLFTNTIQASEILGVDAELRATLNDRRARLLKPKIGKWGQLQEWMSDLDKPGDKHRHVSHLYALFPGNQITTETAPELASAAKVSLVARGDDSTGWSTAWKISLWARLKDGDHSQSLFPYLIRPCHVLQMANDGGGMYPNLLAACPPFQIDANFGFTAGVAEMLLQSHSGTIELLPALPRAWAKNGSFSGLKARGNFVVDCTWIDGKVASYRIVAGSGGKTRLRVNGETKPIDLGKGAAFEWKAR